MRTAPRMNARSARIAWRVAPVLACSRGVALVALMLLMPLKRVEPFVIRVDNSTGIVDVVPVFAGQADDAGSRDALLPRPLRHRLRALQLRDRRERLRGVRSFHTPERNQAWYGALGSHESELAAQSSTRTARGARAGELDEFFEREQRRRGSRAGPVHQDANGTGNGAMSSSRTGSRPSSTSTRAVQRSAHAPLESARLQDRRVPHRSRRCWRRKPRRLPTVTRPGASAVRRFSASCMAAMLIWAFRVARVRPRRCRARAGRSAHPHGDVQRR